MAYIPTKKTDFDSRLAPLLPDYSHAPPDARIIELLQTNSPPTVFERETLEATLSETPDRIAELDSLIQSTTSLLRYLTQDRKQALANQANAKKILTPSRRLPSEMLIAIFTWCRAFNDPGDSLLDPRAVPWLLTHVCRKWREVAIATPEIWSSIRLNFGKDKFLKGNHVHEAAFMLGMILDQARPHDLNVIIQHEDDISTHPACAVLLSSVRYWKSLEVEGISCNPRFLSPCRGFFDRLETAKVEWFLDEGTETVDIFAVAPRLRSFIKSMKAPFLLPANLIKFSDCLPFDADTRATLHSLVNVETISISCSSYSSELPRIHLPRLSQLELTMDLQSVGNAFVMYNHFDLPFLTHLQMTLFFHTKVPLPVLQPISSPTVTSLTLTWFHSVSQQFSASRIKLDLSSLCRLPNLQCLTVKDCANINPFLRALSIHPGRNVIFPNMSKLDIKCGHDFGMSDDVLDMRILVDLVQSRRDQGALRNFQVAWQRGLVNDDADTCSRWQRLSVPGGGIQISASIKGGLDIVLGVYILWNLSKRFSQGKCLVVSFLSSLIASISTVDTTVLTFKVKKGLRTKFLKSQHDWGSRGLHIRVLYGEKLSIVELSSSLLHIDPQWLIVAYADLSLSTTELWQRAQPGAAVYLDNNNDPLSYAEGAGYP
ncbi:hypothetical protein EDD85DRAFT_961522 [Armillaria nabsnona]|nr:hypothetical protein EDD85DRAFT_961522 [Armillaria nabsnona]